MKKVALLIFIILIALPAGAKANFTYTAANEGYERSTYIAANLPLPLLTRETVINGYAEKTEETQPYQAAVNTGMMTSSTHQITIDESLVTDYVPNQKYNGNVQKATAANNAELLFKAAAGLALGILGCAVDPYIVTIDDVQYVMIRDNYDSQWNILDIFGVDDDCNNIFASLKNIKRNDSAKLTGEEMFRSGVRLVRLNDKGYLDINDKSKDFNILQVSYIDMNSLKKSSKNDGQTGQFGTFKVYINNGNGGTRTAYGIVTFEKEQELQKLFVPR